MRLIASLLILFASFSCSPRDGANGPAGPTGVIGPPGSAGQQGDPAPTAGYLSGTVRDGAAALAGVQVATSPATTAVTTGTDGRFRIGPLSIGNYKLTLSLTGYESVIKEGVTVLGGATTDVEVSMSPRTKGLVRGTVRFQNGAPAVNASVSTDRHSVRTTTDARGQYVLEAPATTYALLAVPFGESFASAAVNNVTVPAAGEITVDFTLKPRALGTATFIGSSACAECHPSHFSSWQGTMHNNSVRQVDDPVPSLGGGILPTWAGTLTLARAANVSYQIELSRQGTGYRATLIDSAGARRAFDVTRTQGGGAGWAQRFQARVGGFYQLLPMQWNEVAPRAWVPYKPEYWFDAQGVGIAPTSSVSFEQQCIGCHSTGLQIAHDANNVATRVSYTETNIGCEACHGPGSVHSLSRNAGDIVNPRRLIKKTAGVFDSAGALVDSAAYDGYLRANEVCGQCHSRGVSNASASYQSALTEGTHPFPWLHARGDSGAYQVGEKLDWYLGDRAERWGDTRYDRVASSASSNQQWQDLLEDRKGGATHAKNPAHLVACFDCHNPHGSSFAASTRQPAGDNTLCVSCHAGNGPFAANSPTDTLEAAAMRHTRHFRYSPGDDGQARCIGCHMPRTAQSVTPRDISSHTFRRVPPHESLAMRNAGQTPVPNSCDQCHRNDNDLGARRYELIFGPPAPVAP